MKKRIGIKILVFAFILVTGFFAYRKLPVKFINDVNISSDTIKQDLGVPIEVTSVLKAKLVEKISYMGTLQPKDTMQAAAGIPGEILEIYIEEGEYVKKGQTVAKLEDENIIAKRNTLQAKIDTIEFNLIYLRDQGEKYRILFESNAISKADYDKVSHEAGMVEMQLKELYAQRDEIAVSLKDTVVTAPMSGVVREVNYNPGDLAVMGKPMATIDDVSKLIIKVNISESDLKDIKVGTPVLLEIPGIKDKTAAKVTKVLPSVNPKTRIGEVEIEIKRWDKDHLVIIGASIEAEFIKRSVHDALIVPQGALKQLASGSVLYRIEGEYVREVPVETGIKSNNQVQIVNGLAENDKVAISNIDKLYDGAKVYVFEGEEP
ncbi:MAG: uncharacterized protein K0R80_797 [Clostridia bacterium]|nr:uncharacterized protein [Clostridia bacterium]